MVINLKISESGNTLGKEASEGTTDVFTKCPLACSCHSPVLSIAKERVTTKGAQSSVF